MKTAQSDGSVWHPGELEVRRRAGVDELSEAGVRNSIPQGLAHFLEMQRVAAFGSVDREGKVWASLRVGEPGFFTVVNLTTVRTAPLQVEGDPLLENLWSRPEVGIVVIDFANRRRVRLNGVAEVLADGSLTFRTRQVYGNCPQYIQERVPETNKNGDHSSKLLFRGVELSAAQQQQIAHADTLFIASAHPESGVDASHRGGNPGFVTAVSASRLRIPDYSGNRMFNTLGNIIVNPAVGLVFADFERGRTLQLTGRATIDWDPDPAELPGAQRALIFDVEGVIEIEQPALKTYEFKSYSPFNPELQSPR